ncbi:hypothetical protein GCM10008018_57510 [Paenibacillus marchantiophytorum]|uniref:Uncharacterized protein n=1 Tax=Paenibacillus marchantiophytorum TaxID=1619310 RepID=A0ABQ1FAT2_9BACL|nr:hypothetical protein [Paenibacillus marchantiophytorum]GGA04067.1 hypothetical protein GCM10008018_57510 [Paenibacillus marchantiophytorum]
MIKHLGVIHGNFHLLVDFFLVGESQSWRVEYTANISGDNENGKYFISYKDATGSTPQNLEVTINDDKQVLKDGNHKGTIIEIPTSCSSCVVSNENLPIKVKINWNNKEESFNLKRNGAVLLNNENRHLAKEAIQAYAQKAGYQPAPFKERALSNNIINKNQIKKVSPRTVTNIAVKENDGSYEIPELLTENGDLVIFTKTDDFGWHLNKGEQLTIHYELDLKTNMQSSDPKGENMEIGYIKNGEIISEVLKKAKEFSYTVTADSTGEYYFYAENASAGKIIITTGIIK